MPKEATYALMAQCATIPGITVCRLIAVLGALLVAGLLGLGAAGSRALAASIAATGIEANTAMQGLSEAAQRSHPVYCSPGGHSGPTFNDAANFAHVAPPQDCMTLGVSFRSTFLGTKQVLVGWDSDKHHFGSMQLRLTETGNLEYGEFANSWNSIEVLPRVNFADGSWHTAVVVRNASSSAYAAGGLLVSLYVDGKLAGRGVLPKRRPEHLLQGARSARPGPRHQDYVLQGSVRDLRIYARALGHQQRASMAKDPCPLEAAAN